MELCAPADTDEHGKVESANMRLVNVSYAAADINLYELRPVDGGTVWPFGAGAHVDLALPNGLVRQYSIVNSQKERHRYLLGIKRDPKSRGGSRFIHEDLRVGTLLRASRPRNNFPLNEDAVHSVFIAGGIGITPICSMLRRAIELDLSWQLHYAVRRRDDAVLLDAFPGHGNRCHLHVDDEHGGAPLDLDRMLTGLSPDTHLYCCGPAPMLDRFERLTETWPAAQRHLERFSAPIQAASGGFTVELARSGGRLVVPPGQTILSVLRAAKIEVAASCEQGVCGTCETRVISGTPDHRDLLLSPEEKAANKTMLICCSGSHSDTLVLDL